MIDLLKRFVRIGVRYSFRSFMILGLILYVSFALFSDFMVLVISSSVICFSLNSGIFLFSFFSFFFLFFFFLFFLSWY